MYAIVFPTGDFVKFYNQEIMVTVLHKCILEYSLKFINPMFNGLAIWLSTDKPNHCFSYISAYHLLHLILTIIYSV